MAAELMKAPADNIQRRLDTASASLGGRNVVDAMSPIWNTMQSSETAVVEASHTTLCCCGAVVREGGREGVTA